VETVGTPWLWSGFAAFVSIVLAIDLGIFNRKAHAVSVREAAAWSAVWVSLALVFNLGIWWQLGAPPALEFATGYLIEEALSVDNIFVFIVLFTFFGVPAAYQHRVLFWGILGAVVMRAIFVLAGAALLTTFHWAIYVFGAILIVTGVKLLRHRHGHMNPERNPVLRLFRRLVPTVPEYHGHRFTIVRDGRRYATPLLAVLVAVEATDLVFAVDSIPAVFAVTRDPFIVYTSNIFAVLGLRAMYFMLAGIMDRFIHLKPGLALVLVFVGTKMLVAPFFPIPITISLGVVAAILGTSILTSLVVSRRIATNGRAAGVTAGRSGSRYGRRAGPTSSNAREESR
jgi:tellurite resistance protein TerC